MTDSFLCIGGPFDGRRYDSRYPTFKVAIANPLSFRFGKTEASIDIEEVVYRREFFHMSEGSVSFWVVESKTALQAMETLLETYEQAKRRVLR